MGKTFISRILELYNPVFPSGVIECDLCAKGPCTCGDGESGKCGLSREGVLSRKSLTYVAIGSATHLSSAFRMLKYAQKKGLLQKSPKRNEIELFPISRSLGLVSKSKGVSESVLNLLSKNLIEIISLLHLGQESDPREYIKWSLQAGLIDLVSLEISGTLYSLSHPESCSVKDVEYGIPKDLKPKIAVIGHLPPILDELIPISRGKAEILCLCCLGHEASRVYPDIKFVGSLNQQVKFVESGIADVLILDEQCILPNVLKAAQKTRIKVICVSKSISYGFKDLTRMGVDRILKNIEGELGVVILDEKKAAEVALNLALRSEKIWLKELERRERELKCDTCSLCDGVCPEGIKLSKILEIFSEPEEFWKKCTECMFCEEICPDKVPILGILTHKIWKERIKEGGVRRIKSGRGEILDEELRTWAPSLTLGSIPGVISLLGCPEYPGGINDIGNLARSFLEKGYVVLTAGCTAASLAEEELYKLPYVFQPGSLINLGSCFSSSSALGTLIKISHYLTNMRIDRNYENLADFIHLKVPSCAVFWGIVTPKNYATAHGLIAFGIPVIIPKRNVFPINLSIEEGRIYDLRLGTWIKVKYKPEHLLYATEDVGDAMVCGMKLCLRIGDTLSLRKKQKAFGLEVYFDYIPDPTLLR